MRAVQNGRARALRGRPLLLALAALAAAATRAHACSCVETRLAGQVETSDVVFLGRALGARPSLAHPLRERITTFEVTRVWKGERNPRVDVLTDASLLPFGPIGGCAFPDFERDRSYIVLATRVGRRLYTGICHGTTWATYPDSAAQAAIDSTLRELGPGMPPTRTSDTGLAGDWLLWSAVAAAAGAFWMWRRRRPVVRGG